MSNLDTYLSKPLNTKISAMLNNMFANPPGNGDEKSSEYKTFLAWYGKTASDLRKELLEAIEAGALLDWQADRISACVKAAPWRPKTDEQISAIIEKIESEKFSDEVASQFVATIFHSNLGQRYFENMDPEFRVRVSLPWTRPMIIMSRNEMFPRIALAELLSSTPKWLAPTLLNQFEVCRTTYGIPFDCAYQVLTTTLDLTSDPTISEMLDNFKLASTTDTTPIQ